VKNNRIDSIKLKVGESGVKQLVMTSYCLKLLRRKQFQCSQQPTLTRSIEKIILFVEILQARLNQDY